MRKFLRGLAFGIFGLAILVGVAHAGSPYSVTKWLVVIDSAIVPNVQFATSTVIDISEYSAFSYKLEIHSGSAPDVKITYEVIESTQNFAVLVASETTGEQIKNWVSPITGGTIDSSITSNQCDGFSPIVTRWIKWKVTGVASNGTNTYVSLYIGVYTDKFRR